MTETETSTATETETGTPATEPSSEFTEGFVVVPPNSSVPFALGTEVTVRAVDDVPLLIVPGSLAVVLNFPDGRDRLEGEGDVAHLKKIGTNEWDVWFHDTPRPDETETDTGATDTETETETGTPGPITEAGNFYAQVSPATANIVGYRAGSFGMAEPTIGGLNIVKLYDHFGVAHMETIGDTTATGNITLVIANLGSFTFRVGAHNPTTNRTYYMRSGAVGLVNGNWYDITDILTGVSLAPYPDLGNVRAGSGGGVIGWRFETGVGEVRNPIEGLHVVGFYTDTVGGGAYLVVKGDTRAFNLEGLTALGGGGALAFDYETYSNAQDYTLYGASSTPNLEAGQWYQIVFDIVSETEEPTETETDTTPATETEPVSETDPSGPPGVDFVDRRHVVDTTDEYTFTDIATGPVDPEADTDFILVGAYSRVSDTNLDPPVLSAFLNDAPMDLVNTVATASTFIGRNPRRMTSFVLPFNGEDPTIRIEADKVCAGCVIMVYRLKNVSDAPVFTRETAGISIPSQDLVNVEPGNIAFIFTHQRFTSGGALVAAARREIVEAGAIDMRPGHDIGGPSIVWPTGFIGGVADSGSEAEIGFHTGHNQHTILQLVFGGVPPENLFAQRLPMPFGAEITGYIGWGTGSGQIRNPINGYQVAVLGDMTQNPNSSVTVWLAIADASGTLFTTGDQIQVTAVGLTSRVLTFDGYEDGFARFVSSAGFLGLQNNAWHSIILTKL